MKIAIAGFTGLIGSSIAAEAEKLGHTVLPVLRADFSKSDAEFSNIIEGCDAVINVTGSPVIKRHTEAYRKEIYQSRIQTTAKIVEGIKLARNRPAQLINASAIGIYSGNEANTENSYSYAGDFMATVCADWEQTALSAKDYTRVAIARTAVVLDNKGGALMKMLLPFKLGLGAKIGTGEQMFSWIHMDDLVNAYMHLLNTTSEGIYNLTSPGYLRNSDFTRALANALNRPALLTVPEFMLKLIYGKGAAALTTGQAVYPQRLLDEGFKFKFESIEAALEDLKTGF